AQAAVAHQPHHLALRVGNRGGAGPTHPPNKPPPGGVYFSKRPLYPQKPATPHAAGHADFVEKHAVFLQGFLYVSYKQITQPTKSNIFIYPWAPYQ
ncbi:hypothetical protein ACVGXN_02385, partial [Enterobacter hormaechei]